MAAYYNEFDPGAAAWLRELIKAGLIADGDVDERSITEVHPVDLLGYDQCHFFAGIGGWSYALRLAGWPDDRPVWTGSCPCQPFSAAGKRKGKSDERHLWPEFHRLVKECRPDTVFGEQVAAAIGLDWLDHVQDDMEAIGYACGAIVLPACSVGAPHIRQRLWFVADTVCQPSERGARGVSGTQTTEHRSGKFNGRGSDGFADGSQVGELADSLPSGRPERGTIAGDRSASGSSEPCKLGNADNAGPQGHRRFVAEHDAQGRETEERHQPTAGFWNDADWLPCRDGKARPVEPGTFPLAHGIPARVGRLRGYGNAIVPQVAAEFIKAYVEVTA